MAFNEHSKLNKIKNNMGLIVLFIAFIASCVSVFMNQNTYNNPNVKTLRICHWQLEAGFRDALQVIIDDYEKQYEARTGEKIKIIQVPVAERGYAQFINTGLIGNMAPDIIELGHSKTLQNISNLVRYFKPLGSYLREPNPYNEGTPLQGKPWKDTFFDNMQGKIVAQLQEYYSIPFSMFTIRLYYNKKLLKEITGSDEFPTDYVNFLKLCQDVKVYNNEHKKNYLAVAACQNQLTFFESKYMSTFFSDIVKANDFDCSGGIEATEAFHSFRDGKWSFKSPELIAKDRCLKEISENFMDGWIAAKRDDAAFAFVQGRALMTVTGSWDAKSMVDQARGYSDLSKATPEQKAKGFDVGIADFPYPTEHPEYKKYVTGGVNEATAGGGIPWSINKRSKNIDLVVDFLQYATTIKVNEKFNDLVYWIPVTRGAKIKHAILDRFKPNLEGYSGSIDFRISTEFGLVSGGQKWLLFQGEIDEKDYAKKLEKVYKKTMVSGFKHNMEKNYRILKTYDRVLAAYIILEEMGSKKQAEGVSLRIPSLSSVAEQQSYSYYLNMHRYDTFNVNAGKVEEDK